MSFQIKHPSFRLAYSRVPQRMCRFGVEEKVTLNQPRCIIRTKQPHIGEPSQRGGINYALGLEPDRLPDTLPEKQHGVSSYF